MGNQTMRYMNSRWSLPYKYTHMISYGQTGCLDEDTEIFVCEKGVKNKIKLKDLPLNFNVISYNFKKNKLEIKKANKIDSGIKDCYKIEFDSGKKIIATKDHKFFDMKN